MWKNLIQLPESNSKVTLELRELIDAGINIWDFEYPSFYTGDAKRAFEQKVLDHYAFRQIGQETPARFLHYFRTRVREIMPYYIQLYKSVELMENVGDPFQAYDLTETYSESRYNTGSVSGTTTDTSSSETSADMNESSLADVMDEKLVKFSDTPQGNIENINDHLTNATHDMNEHNESGSRDGSSSSSATATASGSNEQSSEDEGTMEYTLTRKGNIGVQPLGAEINAYRSALINVDMQVINELNDLFLMIY